MAMRGQLAIALEWEFSSYKPTSHMAMQQSTASWVTTCHNRRCRAVVAVAESSRNLWSGTYIRYRIVG